MCIYIYTLNSVHPVLAFRGYQMKPRKDLGYWVYYIHVYIYIYML